MMFTTGDRNGKRMFKQCWAQYQTPRLKTPSSRQATQAFLEFLEDRWLLSAYDVTSAAETDASGTLRRGINEANAPGSTVTEIDFHIDAPGSAHTIDYKTPLPALKASGVFINGLSQNESGANNRLITLNGSSSGGDGLLLKGSGCTVSGLIVENFARDDIEVEGDKNIVGGTAPGAGNVISAAGFSGTEILGSGNQVLGNDIGTDATGNLARGSQTGVYVSGSNNVIGGTAPGAGNLISGNRLFGVILYGPSNQLLGNDIGTDASGIGALGNGDKRLLQSSGVLLAGNNNTVGGIASGSRNVISGNNAYGIFLAAKDAQVLGNAIGTNASGTGALGNATDGIICLGGSSAIIGGKASGAGNVISGNKEDGALITEDTTGIQLLGNKIGTTINGNTALANGIGVEIAGQRNTVGGMSFGDRNLISGNRTDGVKINTGARGNLVLGNFIGTNDDGNGGLGIRGNGIAVDGNDNTIGGDEFGAGNLISGTRLGTGVQITGSGNQVLGNEIGTSYGGLAALSNSIGIDLLGNNNSIGGTASGAGNVISGDSLDGVLIEGGSDGNDVMQNSIGINAQNAALGNGSYGVEIAGSKNKIGGDSAMAGNSIAYNKTSGVLVSSTSEPDGAGNTVRDNSIFANGSTGSGPGITRDSNANPDLAAPSLRSSLLAAGTLTVEGTITGKADVSYVLDFYANPLNDAEGKIWLASLTVKPKSGGSQAFNFTQATSVPSTYPVITATLTDASGDTSAFSSGRTTIG
jgi:hypothetical protein